MKNNSGHTKYCLFGLNFLVCMVAMGLFIGNNIFSVDDYWAFFHQKDSIQTNIEQNLRPISSGVYYLMDFAGINMVEQQTVFGILLVLVIAWVMTRISLEILEAVKAENEVTKILFIDGGTLLLFINAAWSEYLYYSAVYLTWILAVLGTAYAAICIGKEKKVLWNWLVGTAALTITAGSYQTFIAQYAYIVMTIIFIRNEGRVTHKSVFAVFRAVMAAIMAMGINLLLVRFLAYVGITGTNSRMSVNLSEMSGLIADMCRAQGTIWVEGMGMYTRYALAMILLLLLGVLIWVMHKEKADLLKEGACVAFVMISGQCVMYAAQIMQGFIRVTNRGMMSIFGVYTVEIWILCYYAGSVKWEKLRRIGILLTGMFLIWGITEINEVATDIIKTNVISQCYIEEINKRICKYEQENGLIVTKIGFCSDENISYRYYRFINTSAYGDMCANPFLAQWSDINSIYYYTGRNYERAVVPEDVIEYFGNQNWDEADWDEQLIFDNEALYICVF